MPNSRTKPKTSPGLTWAVEFVEPHVYRIDHLGAKSGDTLHVLLISDVHWDSKDCRRDLLKADLDKAKAVGAAVVIAGDLFDVMEGKFDPRAHKDQLRPEFLKGNYLDEIVSQGAEWFAPYAKNLAVVSPGNHEEAIKTRKEVDLINRFVDRMVQAGGTTIAGSYWGFIPIVSNLYNRSSMTIFNYHHGYGGGGEVTRGLIDNSRTRGQYHADIYFSGHIHRQNTDENIVTLINGRGRMETRRQIFLRGSGYKDERDGWHASKGRAARPQGGWWVRLSAKAKDSCHAVDVTYERT